MIDGLSQSANSIREAQERPTHAAQSVARPYADDGDLSQSVAPSSDSSGSRGPLERPRDGPRDEPTDVHRDEENRDLVRAPADAGQAQDRSEANVALIHRVDDGVGSLLDVLA
jgi:hypothetical protein